jgi:exodeoxyribonuclease VII large subunit
LVEALRTLNLVAKPDVILLARGGGSIEDLWAFNDESVVRAVIASAAPVITGVGHETDFTLVDFAADLRAPTPTAAAELATSMTILDLQSGLMQMKRILSDSVQEKIGNQRELLEWTESRFRLHSPARRLQSERQRVDELDRRVNRAQNHCLELMTAQQRGLENRLLALSPLAVLQRGFAVVTKNKKVVTSQTQVFEGDEVLVRVRDGEFNTRVSGNG